MARGLLSGFRALDLTDEKGFVCGKILASMGVDTIKVEVETPPETYLLFMGIPPTRKRAYTGSYTILISVASP